MSGMLPNTEKCFAFTLRTSALCAISSNGPTRSSSVSPSRRSTVGLLLCCSLHYQREGESNPGVELHGCGKSPVFLVVLGDRWTAQCPPEPNLAGWDVLHPRFLHSSSPIPEI